MPRIFMPIAAAFAPNYTLRDVGLALRGLMPSRRAQLLVGEAVPRLEAAFASYLGVEDAVSFNSGRSGFYAILRSLGIGEGDEVILQAFTTVALPNTIRLLGARPVFADIEEGTLNLDPSRLEELITPRTRAIIIQHTFGNPADTDSILAIARAHKLKTIEDCAHSLGATVGGVMTGKLADAAFFSSGRDKVISSVTGGMVVARDPELLARIKQEHDRLDYPEKGEVVRHLLHPLITFSALHTYNLFSLGKVIMFLGSHLGILDKAYTPEEKRSQPRKDFARRMPDALAPLALHQLRLADSFNAHRQEVAASYDELIESRAVGKPRVLPGSKSIFLWYTIAVPDKHALLKKAKGEGIILGDWFPQPVGPIQVDLGRAGYSKGSCSVAEEVSAHAVNLPTHHNMHRREVRRVADFINRNA